VPLASSMVSGRSFQSRYTVVLFPVLMACPALFAVRWMPDLRWRRWAKAGMWGTILFHLALMPSFFAWQGRWIDESPFLAGSHAQLEKIDAALRARAPEGWRIVVDAEGFLDGGEPDRWDRQGVWMVPATCRIQNHLLGVSPEAPAATYRLVNTRRDGAAPDRAAYDAHGIALIPTFAAPPAPAGPGGSTASPVPGG
jgi:hypothetical protein